MNENEIIMENAEVVEDIIEVIPEKKGVDFGKIGLGVLVVGGAVVLGYKVYKLIKAKKTQTSQGIENSELVDSNDFHIVESEE